MTKVPAVLGLNLFFSSASRLIKYCTELITFLGTGLEETLKTHILVHLGGSVI